MQAAGIDHRLGVAIATEHDKQVRYHHRPPLRIQIDDARRGELFQRHVDHAHRPLDDLRPRRHDGLSLLPLQHCRCDFLGISQVRNPGLDHFDTGFVESLLHVDAEFRSDLVGIAAQADAVVVVVVRVA